MRPFQDELTHLRALLLSPEERTAYADWLETHDEPRARLARLAPDADDIRYVAWLEADGHLDFYTQTDPEIRRAFDAWQATRNQRDERAALAVAQDPSWVAFLSTLARPFEPFFFFNNHGNERELEPDELPFSEPLGTRGALVTFASDFGDPSHLDEGLLADLALLRGLELTECAYGAATCPVHPFLCELEGDGPFTASMVLRALRARDFRSKYIRDLNCTHVPFPGYHPGTGRGVENDEIHDDFRNQRVFVCEDNSENDGAHGELKRSVVDGKLWYVLLHTTPQRIELPPDTPRELLVAPSDFSRYVVLFAVGRSSHGRRLIGVVTHQCCADLCD